MQVQNLQNGAQLTVSLIDLGPSKSAAGVMRVNYTILGGAKFVSHSSTASVSLMQSEMNTNGGITMPDLDPDHGQSHGIAIHSEPELLLAKRHTHRHDRDALYGWPQRSFAD